MLFLLLLGALPAAAQLRFHSLDEVLHYADAHAISLRQAAISEQIAVSGRREARADLLPSVQASLGYNDNITLQPTLVPTQLFNPAAPEGSFEEFIFGTRYQYNAGLQAQWDVLNFQKIFALKTANIQEEGARAYSEVSRYQTYHALASTYYSILLTQESIRLYEENLRVAVSLLEHATDKYEQGIISEAERNRARINMLHNQSTLKQARNQLEQHYLQLQSQLNTTEAITVTDVVGPFVLEDTGIHTRHPEVIWRELEVSKQQSVLKQTQALRYPTVSLVYQLNGTWATNSFMDFADATELPQQLFGLRINLAGLTSTTTRQKIRQSELQLQLEQQQLGNTRLVKQWEDQRLQLQYEQAAEQLADQEEILALQERNDVHAENKYRSGLLSLDERLNSYDDLLAARDHYLQSLAAFTLARYQIYIRQIDFQAQEN